MGFFWGGCFVLRCLTCVFKSPPNTFSNQGKINGKRNMFKTKEQHIVLYAGYAHITRTASHIVPITKRNRLHMKRKGDTKTPSCIILFLRRPPAFICNLTQELEASNAVSKQVLEIQGNFWNKQVIERHCIDDLIQIMEVDTR